jgi:hypothetical protein
MLPSRPSDARRRACGGLIVIVALIGCRAREERATQPARNTTRAESAWVTPGTASIPTPGAGFPADTPATPGARASRPTAAPPPATTSGPTPTRRPATTSARGRTSPSTRPASPRAAEAADSAARRDTAVASATPAAPAAAPAPPPLPVRAFSVGERLTYDVRFGPIRVGQASMEVVGVEPFRGRDAYHTRFLLRGGTPFYRVNDRYESWFDARTLESLRYAQQIDQGSYERERLYDVFPERRTYAEAGKPEQPSVADPLDDGSFLYFLRTIPLEVGKSYEFNRYFRPDRNPVRVTVLRRERIRVPAGTFDAIVVRPTIKTTGIFSEGGRAEVWFADDTTRRMLQMKSRLSFGSLSLELRRIE